MTLNSPESLAILHQVASSGSGGGGGETSLTPVQSASLVRETGLKCVSFNGLPRTINCLTSFRDSLDEATAAGFPSGGMRVAGPVKEEDEDEVRARGLALWESVYAPLDGKLLAKLGRAHPDLSGYILCAHYGMLLSDPPPGPGRAEGETDAVPLGRCLTSVVAMACLRAQTGAGPQLLSHVYGLRKAIEQGAHLGEGGGRMAARERGAMERLAGDEGCEWVLRSVDRIAEVIGSGFGERPVKSKL